MLLTDQINDFQKLYETIEKKPDNAANLIDLNENLTELQECITNKKERLKNLSRTAKLWIQYLEYIDLLKLFIRAERTGNWTLYLSTLSKMINLFAATGHLNYAKSARLHLQQMLELETTHPWVYIQTLQSTDITQ